MPNDPRLTILHNKIATYGKENQGELLYSLAEGARLLSGCDRVRIYLEDLTRGVLSCVHVAGEMAADIREQSFPIISTEAVVSRVFVSQYPVDFKADSAQPESPDSRFAQQFDVRDSYIMPVVSLGKSMVYSASITILETGSSIHGASPSWPISRVMSPTGSTRPASIISRSSWPGDWRSSRRARWPA
jgi:hypothetical protein